MAVHQSPVILGSGLRMAVGRSFSTPSPSRKRKGQNSYSVWIVAFWVLDPEVRQDDERGEGEA
jgi:hypothetical protein